MTWSIAHVRRSRADKAHAILAAMGIRVGIARRGGRSLRPSAGLHVGRETAGPLVRRLRDVGYARETLELKRVLGLSSGAWTGSL
jgi:hypothetical protein